MDANEEINTSYINDNLEKVEQNINYYFNEPNEQRKYEYLRTIKNTLRKLGAITLRNVVDLKRNIDNTFKNEPNYKNKRAKLLNLDMSLLERLPIVHSTAERGSHPVLFRNVRHHPLDKLVLAQDELHKLPSWREAAYKNIAGRRHC